LTIVSRARARARLSTQRAVAYDIGGSNPWSPWVFASANGGHAQNFFWPGKFEIEGAFGSAGNTRARPGRGIFSPKTRFTGSVGLAKIEAPTEYRSGPLRHVTLSPQVPRPLLGQTSAAGAMHAWPPPKKSSPRPSGDLDGAKPATLCRGGDRECTRQHAVKPIQRSSGAQP
jgi:hypothetical protein